MISEVSLHCICITDIQYERNNTALEEMCLKIEKYINYLLALFYKGKWAYDFVTFVYPP
jgi:hypothetical protein